MRLFLIITLLTFLTACSDKPLKPISPTATILAFGDSLTVGFGTTPENAYPQQLAKLSGRKVINAGINGETTAQGLQRLPELLNQHTPDLVILMQGTNDLLQKISPKTIYDNLAEMVELLQNNKIPIVLIGIPEQKLFSNSALLYRTLAEQYRLVFNDDLLAGLYDNEDYKSDEIHLNQEGYLEMAKQIHQFLIDKGALAVK